jgi:hypothetical protein
MGMTPGSPPNTAPAILSALDPTHNWSQIGTIDPTTHIFTVAGGGGGGGGAVTAAAGAFVDGYSPTQGSTTDPACANPTAACSLVALTRAMWNAMALGVGNVGQTYPSQAVGLGADSTSNIVPVYQAEGVPGVINVSAAGTTQIVAPVNSKRLIITGFDIVGTGSGTSATFVYGTQTTTPCDTGQHPLTGPYPPGIPVARGALGATWILPVSTQLCLIVAGTSPQYSGSVSFTSAN